MVGPGTAVVELDIGLPVAERGAALAAALVGQRQVVMGVGVAGRERDGFAVGGDGLVEPVELVEHVAEIEVGQHVAGIGLGGAAVELFGAAVLAQMEKHGAQIDAGCRVLRIDLENFLVERDGALLFAGFLGLDGGLESLLNATQPRRAGMAQRRRRAAPDAGCGRPMRSKSKSNWRRMGSTMAPRWRKARRVPVRTTRASSSGLAMPDDCFHGQDGFADGGRGYVVRAQRAQRAQLPEILKAIEFLLGNQPGSFPGLQLAGTDLRRCAKRPDGDSWSLWCAPTGGADQSQALQFAFALHC